MGDIKLKKIIFMGTPAFSVPILEGLLQAGYHIQAVVTQPDRPVGRKKIVTPTPVKEVALRHHLPILQPEKIANSKEMETIIKGKPDLIITAAFGQFLPEQLLNCATYGAINVHASLLPKYRGGAPAHYALINGDDKTGITIIKMVKKMDAGDILSQRELAITKQDNVGTMFERLSSLGKELLLDTLPKILENKINPEPQDEKKVSFSPNITREQEKINWKKAAVAIDNQVRGMCPWPIAFTTYQNLVWKLWKTTPIDETTTAEPGTIVKKNKKALWIACGDNKLLAIEVVQPAGKGKLSIQDFLNGFGKSICEGQKLGE